MATTDDEDPAGNQPEGPQYITIHLERKFRVRPPTAPISSDPPPDSILLDHTAYLSDRANSSTADGYTAAGHLIRVTFWIRHPPRVSYLTVHFPGLPTSALAELPRVLSSDGDLVLLRVAVCPRHVLLLPEYNDYVVYRAGFRELQVLPAHPDRLFPDSSVGLLRCRHDDNDDGAGFFFVASLSSLLSPGHFELDLFDSRTRRWITKPVHVESCYAFSSATKVIAIGGEHGSIAWADLFNGILIYDVLRGDDTLRYIGLPVLLAPNKMRRGARSDRDIAICNGHIKYFKMCVHVQPGWRGGTTYVSQDWEAAAWRWMDSEKRWHMDYRFKASEAIVDESQYALLPSLILRGDVTETMPVLSRLHTGHPALSLHDNDVVYIMSKVDRLDQQAWMLAVDMRNNTVREVVKWLISTLEESRASYSHIFKARFPSIWPKSRQLPYTRM